MGKLDINTLYRLVIGAALAAGFFGAAAPPSPAMAAPVKRLVDNDGVECPAATYTTIGAAVADSGPGDTITVCDGVYTEQVVIVSKPGLKLIGKGWPRIVPPDNTDGAIILVSDSRSVTIQGLVIDGGLNFSPTSTWMAGVAFLYSSGTISKNYISRIHRDVVDVEPQGDGIYLYGSPSPTPRVVKILNNTISEVQHAGILVQGGYKPTITRNWVDVDNVKAYFPTGILLDGLASGSVNNNMIANSWGSGGPNPGDGITLLDTSHVKVASNTITDARYGVLLKSQTGVAEANTISGNRILDSYCGIFFSLVGGPGTNHNVIKRNKVISMVYWKSLGLDGMWVKGAGNKVTGNTILGYIKPGYFDAGTGTIFSGNKWAKLPAPGS